MSAEAVVRDYEEAAKAIEAIVLELRAVTDKTEQFLQETAAMYRQRAKQVFIHIEQCAIMTETVRKTCLELRDKLAHSDH